MIAAPLRNATCASCQRFPISALERGEAGECAIFEQTTEHSNIACVLYEPATDREARRIIVQRINLLTTGES